MITKMYLLNVPLETDYKHTLYFESAEAQKSYFDSKVKHSYTDFSYQRRDSSVRLPIVLDDALECNYVMYQNTDYSNKWYYAFITDYVWNDEDTTTITIETDVLQTYMFDYTVKPSFVEREHTSNDAIGENTYPENLECGEYTVEFTQKMSELNEKCYVMGVASTEDGRYQQGGKYSGMYSGISYCAYEEDNTRNINESIKGYADKSNNDNIKVLFIAPKFLCEYNPGSPDLDLDKMGWVIESETCKQFYFSFNKFSGEYTPKNKKLDCYPYRYLLMSNNNGGSAIYQYEHFAGEEIRFLVSGVLSPGCSIRAVPQRYKGMLSNEEEGLNLGKYPICNWTSDEYTNWLTQNGMNIGINMVTGVGQIVAGGLMAVSTAGLGTVVGGSQIVSGVNTIVNQMAQVHQMSFTPNQARGNVNCGDVITSTNNNTFTFYGMTIKDEYMRIIDEFFDMFGYKCNRVKVPEKAHRQNWWFTKTIDVNIVGNVPQMDMEKIKNCYNNGVTFWRNSANIKDYSKTNTIV